MNQNQSTTNPSHAEQLGHALTGKFLNIDAVLTAQQLQFKYDDVGEHPFHSVSEWRAQVASHQTLLGYWDWVAAETKTAVPRDIH